MLKPAYTEKRALDTFLITVIMVQMRIYSDVDCRPPNWFSENERFKLHLLHFTAKLSVLCPMLIGVVLSLMEILLLPLCQLSVYFMDCIQLSGKVPVHLSL